MLLAMPLIRDTMDDVEVAMSEEELLLLSMELTEAMEVVDDAVELVIDVVQVCVLAGFAKESSDVSPRPYIGPSVLYYILSVFLFVANEIETSWFMGYEREGASKGEGFTCDDNIIHVRVDRVIVVRASMVHAEFEAARGRRIGSRVHGPLDSPGQTHCPHI